MAALGAVEEAVAGEEVEAAVGAEAGGMRHMGMHPMLGIRRMGLDIHHMELELGIHPMPPHGDRPPARNRRPSFSKTNKDSSSSRWRRSTSGSKNSLLRKKSKKVRGRGLPSPPPCQSYRELLYIKYRHDKELPSGTLLVLSVCRVEYTLI
jgi:hypothetical protein